jgi:hypothetical protein
MSDNFNYNDSNEDFGMSKLQVREKSLLSLPEDQLQCLLASKASIDTIDDCLSSCCYFPRWVRKYLSNLLAATGEELELINVLNKKVSELPYIEKHHRDKIWEIFRTYKADLLEVSRRKTKSDDLAYVNGEMTPEFLVRLSTVNYLYSVTASKYEGKFTPKITGSQPEEKFFEDFSEYKNRVHYKETVVKDDSNSTFGDILIPNLIDVPLLPISLHSTEGLRRGTVGAYL